MKVRLLGLVCAGFLTSSALAQQSSPATSSLARQLNDSFAAVYEKVAPAVVVIEVRRMSDAALSGLPEGLEFFFRTPDGRQIPAEPDQGSGFIISQDGYILTNNHVVEAAAKDGITVRLKDGRKLSATLVGTDEKSDIAVIKVQADHLPVAELGSSDKAKVGQFAFAIGAPFDLPYTFTVGVISAKGRSNLTGSRNFEEYIQTDASINPGNSGGPLCDIDGKVIGINTLISGMNRGLGFAVPIDIARNISQQLIASGHVTRPWLGIGIESLEDGDNASNYPGLQNGVVVKDIEPGTPASQSDLRAGDVIVKVDNVPVQAAHDLQREILSKKIGQTVQLDVWRDGALAKVALQTGEQPDRLQQASNQRFVPRGESPNTRKKLRENNTLGLVMQNLPAGQSGVGVSDVIPDSAASAAGLQEGDIITEAAGKPVTSVDDFKASLSGVDLSRGVMLMVDRNGQKTFAILKP